MNRIYPLKLILWHIFHILTVLNQVITGIYIHFVGKNPAWVKLHKMGGIFLFLTYFLTLLFVIPQRLNFYLPWKSKGNEWFTALRYHLYDIFFHNRRQFEIVNDPIRKILRFFAIFIILPVQLLTGAQLAKWLHSPIPLTFLRGLHIVFAYGILSFILIHVYLNYAEGERTFLSIFTWRKTKEV